MIFFKKNKFDAHIVSERSCKNEIFGYYVKLSGVGNTIFYSEDEVLYKYPEKFPQNQLRDVAINYEKFKRKRFKIKALSDSYAIIDDNYEEKSFKLNFSDPSWLLAIDIKRLDAQDIFNLGVFSEKFRNAEIHSMSKNIKGNALLKVVK